MRGRVVVLHYHIAAIYTETKDPGDPPSRRLVLQWREFAARRIQHKNRNGVMPAVTGIHEAVIGRKQKLGGVRRFGVDFVGVSRWVRVSFRPALWQ